MSTIVTETLDNGLLLAVEPMAGVRSAGVCWLVPGGAAADPEDRQGLCAMHAELLLRGAGTLDSRAQADAFDRLGVNRSVDASVFHTRFAATMVGDRFDEAMPLLADMVLRPRFDAASIDPARDLALQAIESLRDDPQERALLAARQRHDAAPMNRSGLGTPEGLAAITRGDVVDSWSRRARPGGSILAVAGAVEPGAVRRAVARALKGWEGAYPDPVIDRSGPRGYAHEQDETNQVQIVLMHDAPREADPACTAERVVAGVLSGGMSGRLFAEVREKRGLCYSVSASYSAEKRRGRVTAYVGTTPDRAQESLDVLVAELDRIGRAEGRITDEEFGRAVVGMKSRLVFAGESTGARAAALASDLYRIGRARPLSELAADVDRVTLAGVREHALARRRGVVTIQTLGPATLNPPA